MTDWSQAASDAQAGDFTDATTATNAGTTAINAADAIVKTCPGA